MRIRPVKSLLLVSAFVYVFFGVVEMDAFARAGSGKSFGSRGSRSSGTGRSYSTPAPSQPKSDFGNSYSTQPRGMSPQPQSGGFLRGIAGGVMGGIMGGFLGSMLFKGMGGSGGFGSGIGLFEILLVGAILFGVYWFFKNRRRWAAATSEDSPGKQYSYANTAVNTYATDFGRPPEGIQPPPGGFGRQEVDANLQSLRQSDPFFDEERFRDACSDTFFRIQAGWTKRDLEPVKGLLMADAFATMKEEVDDLKRQKRINCLENIAVRSVEPVEVWQEPGSDYITVRFLANLLDFTVDEATGQVIAGSRFEPVKFEEYWTFTRPVGNHPWRVSSIQQA